MLKFFRFLTLVITPALFLGAWYVIPELLAGPFIRWMSGIITILWGFEFYVFQKLSTLSSTDGLTLKEQERLFPRLTLIRNRIWWIGGISIASVFTLWILAALELPKVYPFFAAAAGFLFGVSLSYLIIIPGWINETQSFLDLVQRRKSLDKDKEELLKSISTNLNK